MSDSQSRSIIKRVVKKQSIIKNNMKNYVKIVINEENCQPFGDWRKVVRLLIITLQLHLKKENKQTNKQSSLLTLTFSCQKRSYLIKSKKKRQKNMKK